jgi:hypothetical protein
VEVRPPPVRAGLPPDRLHHRRGSHAPIRLVATHFRLRRNTGADEDGAIYGPSVEERPDSYLITRLKGSIIVPPEADLPTRERG